MISSLSVLRESKTDASGREVENRVIFTPGQVKEISLQAPGVKIFVEDGAGLKIGIADGEYQKAGAAIVSHDEALQKDLIAGVKETKPEDFPKLGNSIWLSYQHFAESEERTKLALSSKAAFIALETIEKDHKFPCLAPMSEAAGRIVARHADIHALLKLKIISSGLSQTGLKGSKAVIIGAGTVGRTAAEEFKARGYSVELLGRSEVSPARLKDSISGSTFLVSAMYTAGKRPEKLIKKEHLLSMMPEGCAYVVDIDQGGGVEGARQTSIHDIFDLPKFEGTDIYCFAPPNIPSLGARTASEALGSTVMPYVIELLKYGLEEAIEKNRALKLGLNIFNGKIAHPGLASVFPEL